MCDFNLVRKQATTDGHCGALVDVLVVVVVVVVVVIVVVVVVITVFTTNFTFLTVLS